MAEQKNHNNELNVEDALTQSEAFLIKNKKAIIGGVVAVIIIVAGVIMYKHLYAEPREEKAHVSYRYHHLPSRRSVRNPVHGFLSDWMSCWEVFLPFP